MANETCRVCAQAIEGHPTGKHLPCPFCGRPMDDCGNIKHTSECFIFLRRMSDAAGRTTSPEQFAAAWGKRATVAIALLLLASCGGTAPTEAQVTPIAGKTITEGWDGTKTVTWTPTNRFTVEYQQTFHAGYENNRRDILLLTDTKTGITYLAVTGCGTTELHNEARNEGKTTTTIRVEE